jgi:hypothetical protein
MPIPYDTTVFNGKLYVKEEDMIRICEKFRTDHIKFRAMVKKEYDDFYSKENEAKALYAELQAEYDTLQAEYDQLDDVDWETVAISVSNQPEPDKKKKEEPKLVKVKVKKEEPKLVKVKVKVKKEEPTHPVKVKQEVKPTHPVKVKQERI